MSRTPNPDDQSRHQPTPSGPGGSPAQREVRKASHANGGGATRNRLPTLQEVLARKTRPPVDLYCFYLYLQRERAEDVLDFWLDAQQHENLCRAYFKDLRRSGINLQDEWPDYYERARTRGSVFNGVNKITRDTCYPATGMSANDEKGHSPTKQTPASFGGVGTDDAHSRSASGMSGLRRTPSPRPHAGLHAALSPTMRALFPDNGAAADEEARRRSGATGRRPKTPVQPVIPRSSEITRTDLIASAERIYHRYLLTGAEKEIYLPPQLRIHDFPLSAGSLPHAGSEDYEEESRFLAEIPDLFVAQKEYVYRSMEQDTFPRFLRAKAFGNLTPLSALVRLGVGLVCLWIALSTAFALIFLDVKPRRVRFWLILPFAIAVLFIVAHFYDVDPLLITFNRSETTPFRTLQIKEKYVRKILRGRAVWVTVLTALIVTVLCAVFISVPGHRL